MDTEDCVSIDQHLDILPLCKPLHSRIRPILTNLTTDEYVDYIRHSPSIHLIAVIRKTSKTNDILALAIYRTFLTTFDGIRFEIEDLVVDENEKRRKLGTKILKVLEDKAKEIGVTRLSIHCPLIDSGAQRFLFRFGLTITLYEFEVKLLETCSSDARYHTINIDEVDQNQRKQWLLKMHPVHRQLRGHLPIITDDYVHLMESILQDNHVRFIAVVDSTTQQDILGLALYRICDYFKDKYLYCDDLVTDERRRSSGVGRVLIDSMKTECQKLNINRFLLDSGCQRGDAHRFYCREYFSISRFGFSKII